MYGRTPTAERKLYDRRMFPTLHKLQMCLPSLLGAVKHTRSRHQTEQTEDTLRCCIIQPLLAQSVRAGLQHIEMAGLAASFSAAAPARVPTSADFSARSHASHCGLEQVRPERRTWGLRRQQLLSSRSIPNAASQTAGSTLLEQAASEFCGDGAAGPSMEKCCQQHNFKADSW